MLDILKKGDEKKVEYLELIYDLIFVYIIGRSNSLLHTVVNGFVAPSAYLTYILLTLVILQIWYLTVIFINKFGSNGIQETVAIFINMYLLYYMAQSIREDWHAYYYRFCISWALILLNIALQYLIKLKKVGNDNPSAVRQIRRNVLILTIQIAIILGSLVLFKFTGFPAAVLAMIVGVLIVMADKKSNELVMGDFPHLTERVMLYVVFTFGEMMIAITEYFEGGCSFNTVYFSLCAFLIIAGLFLTYGFMYDNVINREMQTSGTEYMFIHIFLIVALNNITAALEYMRMDEVNALYKTLFIVVSFAVYFITLFSLEKYATQRCKGSKKFFITVSVMSVLFMALITAVYRNSYLSIALSVVYIYSMFIYLIVSVRRASQA